MRRRGPERGSFCVKLAIDADRFLIYNSTELRVRERNYQKYPIIYRFSDQILPGAAREGQGRSTV